MENGKTKQFRWSELRNADRPDNELFFVISELTSDCWQFFERSSWDTTWISVPATSELIIRAVKELNMRQVIDA